MLRHFDHADQQGFQKGPSDSDFIDLLHIPDGIPTIVTGCDDLFGTGGQNLIPLDF